MIKDYKVVDGCIKEFSCKSCKSQKYCSENLGFITDMALAQKIMELVSKGYEPLGGVSVIQERPTAVFRLVFGYQAMVKTH